MVARGDLRIYLECRPEGVLLHPRQLWRPAETLSHSPDHNSLTKAVRQFIADRQAAVPGSAPLCPKLLFLLRPNSTITYERAKDALRGLGLPMFYRAVEHTEDVSVILTGGG